MQRGKSQVLFRYLPECVIDHSDTKAFGKIAFWNAVKSEQINEHRLVSEILPRIERFRNRRGYPQKTDINSLAFLEPSSIEVELFPLTFVCESCGRAYSFDDIDRFRRQFQYRGYRCGCKDRGNLRQLDMIGYHKCGRISSLPVKRCSVHGYDAVILDTNNSSSPSNWRWRCGICNSETGRVDAWCQECNKKMEIAPFRKSQVFYPQSVSLINTPGFDNSKDYENPDVLKLYLANYLGMISDDEFQQFRSNAKEDARLIQAQQYRAEMEKQGIPRELIDNIMRGVGISDLQKLRQESLDQINAIFRENNNNLSGLVSPLQSFRDALTLPGAKDIDNVLQEARGRNDPNSERILQFPEALQRAGISEAYVVSDLPIVSAVFGYSRSTTDPSECTLRGFAPDKKYAEKTPVYVNPTATEGIILLFDRWRILRWLEANRIIRDIPDKTDEAALKQWFLTRIDPEKIPFYDEIPSAWAETKHVYTLIHTISHILVRTAAGQVGMDKDSLAEVVFPNVPAIAIYTNNTHDYQIGGMHTLFDTGIIPWIDLAKERVEKCLYDPVCISSEASCHACLHLSEISCAHFNRDLGRHYLIGGREDPNPMVGFWEKDFLEGFT